MNSDFNSSSINRTGAMAKAGLKVGTNYAKKYLTKRLGKTGEPDADFNRKNAGIIFDELSKLRGTALKLAQGLSMDQGFLPAEFAEVMAQAQYQVPPINKALVRAIIKQELGNYPEKVFKTFDVEAKAAASIGQVHRAVLHDGREVAVKIQYPNVRETINSDLAVARTLIKQFVKKGADIDPYFDEVRSTLLLETDYVHEGTKMKQFYQKFSGDRFAFPEWIEEFSTGKVLTMSFLSGKHIPEFLSDSPDPAQKNKYGQLLWDFFHEQIQNFDFVHADTHPGNFLLTSDGKLGILDFGCIKTFPEDFFRNYLELLPSHLSKNEPAIHSLYKKLGILKANPSPDEAKEEEAYFRFASNYGYLFAKPYAFDSFDFGNPEFKSDIRYFTREAPLSNEPRGSKHFIYSTKVHVGLYNLLMKLQAHINTTKSRKILGKMLDMDFGEVVETSG